MLPFYYLGLYLLAAIAVSEVARTIAQLAARDPERPGIGIPIATTGVALLASFVLVGLPLGRLPGGERDASDGSYRWLGLEVDQTSFVRSWAKWNYSGYIAKDAYAEYRDVVQTMAELGETNGCGRTFWEYDAELNRYGTPMALMLLPHWTEGCIGSMEGLYFESSETTPYHFLLQSELSPAPSSAQRCLPYEGFDIDRGVQHLQLLGVRYYMATSPEAIEAAESHPDLTEVAASGPWKVFEVSQQRARQPAGERAGRARRTRERPPRLDRRPSGPPVRRPRRRVVPGPRAPAAADRGRRSRVVATGRCRLGRRRRHRARSSRWRSPTSTLTTTASPSGCPTRGPRCW